MDLPEVPDLAVLVLPTRIVLETLDACGQKGIRHAIVVSGGFKEVGGDGPELEAQLKRTAAKYDIRFLGPNCIGVANPHHKLNTTFLPDNSKPGYIGFASQSGSFVTQMFGYLSEMNQGFSTAFSVGNEADVDIVDCMEYLGACPHTKVIGLYIEGIKRGSAFVRTAKAIVPYKPIVALYVGGSETGKRAGFSHTGALAGPDELYDGMFRQSGIIRAQSLTELFDFCWVLGGMPRPKGPRVVIQTHSGGPGASAADAVGRAGLELPTLSRETEEKLSRFVPHTGSVGNPVDVTFSKNPLDYFNGIPEALLGEKNGDMLLFYALTPAQGIRRALKFMKATEDQMTERIQKIMEAQCQALASLFNSRGKPLVCYVWRGLDEPFTKRLISEGIPTFLGPERAARALSALVHYSRSQQATDRDPSED
jgi:acyl-CoA synthetase (NDP forming)